MDDQQQAVPPAERRLGASGERLTHFSILFGLVFVLGFAIVAAVLLSRRKKR